MVARTPKRFRLRIVTTAFSIALYISTLESLKWLQNHTFTTFHAPNHSSSLGNELPVLQYIRDTATVKRPQGNHIPEELLPRPVTDVLSLTRTSPDAHYHRLHPWNRPMVLTSYVAISDKFPNSVQLRLYLTGVSMGNYQRNFTVAGCLVGTHVYPLIWFIDDVAFCQIPHSINRGDILSAVLLNDQVLKHALAQPTALQRGVVGVIEDGDINELSSAATLHGELGAYSITDFVSIRSLQYYDGSPDVFKESAVSSLPRFELCLMTQIAPYTGYLLPWIDYHRRIGVDMVYLFDNHADEDLTNAFSSRNDVTVVYWPWAMSQTQAFTYFLSLSKPRCEWVLYADVDEYIMLGLEAEDLASSKQKPLPKYISRLRQQGYPQIFFRYIIMHNSGYRVRPKEPLPIAYTHRKAKQEYISGKSICETEFDWVVSKIHACVPLQKEHRDTPLSGDSEENMRKARFELFRYKGANPSLFPKTLEDDGMLVHFRHLSWEDEIVRREGPRSSILSRQVNKTSTSSLDINSPPRFYLDVEGDDKVPYTHFRTIYERVLEALDLNQQTIVFVKDEMRCKCRIDAFNQSRVGHPRCMSVSEALPLRRQ